MANVEGTPLSHLEAPLDLLLPAAITPNACHMIPHHQPTPHQCFVDATKHTADAQMIQSLNLLAQTHRNRAEELQLYLEAAKTLQYARTMTHTHICCVRHATHGTRVLI
jgi:hypothetical protein